ncbi:Linker histone H1/H5, domain H15 [Dillenia turbinata]|uniref:Linker histone H1/H5, domain H15 n=1 Tax=Dillenia turbinata TaxID=194707 RepID=A0AAN8VVN7_9MAGN
MAIPKKISTVGKEERKAMKLSPTHPPPYAMMICEAISSLKERNGSSQQAISKFIHDKYSKQLPPNFKKSISLQLKKSVQSEEIIKVKNSFKISVTATNKNPEKPTKENSDFSKEKIRKMKLLSQVKTPEALKKKKKPKSQENICDSERVVKKTKRLSQVKTPEVLKKKKVSTPLKMKKTTSASRVNSSRARRARN